MGVSLYQINVLSLALLGIFFIFLNWYSLQHPEILFVPASVSAQGKSFWTTGTSMPTPRSEIGACVLDGRIYVIGGQDFHVDKLSVVEVYDPKTDKWTGMPSLPEALDHFGVASYDEKIYVVGGSSQDKHTSNKLFIYDSVKNKWKEGKPMPTSRTMLSADFINGILYAVGGVDSSYKVVPTNEAYDPKTDTWTKKAPMLSPRHHTTSEVVGGKLYVIGGRLKGDGVESTLREALLSFNNNEYYDPKQNNWTSLKPMPTNRSSMSSAQLDSNIYVFGGQSRVPTPTDAYVFGGESKVKSSNIPRGLEMLFAGQTANGTFATNEKYNTKTDTWLTEPSMPTARLGSDSVALDNRLYVIGGKPSFGRTVTNVVEIYHVDNLTE
jgi:N-acetylneuraminic acid mutarotase